MNKKLPIIAGSLLLALMLVGIAGTAIAYAQDPTPPAPPAGQDGERGPRGGHGFLSEAALTAAADVLGITSDELSTELRNGKTLQDLADAAGVDLQVVQDAIKTARTEETRQWIGQSVNDGTITQEKADWLLEGLDKGFLDGPGFGFGFGRGPGGPPPTDPPQTDPDN